jgi:hypothetical protein
MSGGRREVAHQNLGERLAGVSCDLEHLGGDIFGDVGLAAVLADVGRDLVDDGGLALAMKRHGRRSRLRCSVVADVALHRLVLRVLKSGSHGAWSGW